MEFDGIRKLKESLDKCLLAHATELCGSAPTIGSVYELQGLAEVHCYLKTIHEITPDEADALLRFADPLAVVYACWEDNPHTYSFPICELLEQIKAEENFPLAEEQPPEKLPVRDQSMLAIKRVRRSSSKGDGSRTDGTR